MQRGELEARREAIKTKFFDLEKQKDNITQEQWRLQGQYDLLGDLINSAVKQEEENATRGTEERLTNITPAPHGESPQPAR